MEEKDREFLAALVDEIGVELNSGKCKSVRFMLTVWCDCSNVPSYSASNERDIGRVLKMLKVTTDTLMAVPPVEEGMVGHA